MSHSISGHSFVRPPLEATRAGVRAVIIGRSRCRLEVRDEQKDEELDIAREKQTTERVKVMTIAWQEVKASERVQTKRPLAPLCGDISNCKRSELSGLAFPRTELCGSEDDLQFLVLRLELPAGW